MERGNRLEGKRVLLGVSGSIAAYKAADIVRRLREQGAEVTVVLTRNAERFVSRLTFQALSGNPVPHPGFQETEHPGIGHIEGTSGLDVAVLAPATANVIGKLASGIADDTLTTTLMAVECPLIIAPAMNDRMYRNPVVRKNIASLKEQGVRFVGPGTGSLACGTAGQGRLADVESILCAVNESLVGDCAGLNIVVTAGPTREHIDPVRFISSPSTGKMGYALAEAARARGAAVRLISGPSVVEPPHGIHTVHVSSAADMHKAVMEHLQGADVLIMAAAVSDFRPVLTFDRKIKKQNAATQLELERTEDILSAVKAVPGKRLVVGFAAETDNLAANAEMKMRDKKLDMIVANNVLEQGAGFGADTNRVVIVDKNGGKTELPLTAKREIAEKIIDKMLELRKK